MTIQRLLRSVGSHQERGVDAPFLVAELKASASSQTKSKAAQICEILQKRRYRRDSAYLQDKMMERVKSFIEDNEPIKLVGLWGFGAKEKTDWADETSCTLLAGLNEEVRKIHPAGIEFIFVFAIPHALFNGIEKDKIESYKKSVEELFKKYRFKYLDATSLWEKYGVTFEKIEKVFCSKENGWWDGVKNAGLLEMKAKNRNVALSSKVAAKKYYIMRCLEKGILEEEFKDAIFHTFTDSGMRSVLPSMPTLYFYGIKRGRSDAPWFVAG